MAKKKVKKNNKSKKFKGSFTHIIRKIFEKDPSAEMSLRQLCIVLDIKESELRKQVYGILRDLVNADFLKETSHGTFKMNANLEIYEGEIQITQRGAGYVLVNGLESDIYVSEKNLNHALNGDKVKVSLTKKSSVKFEGQIVEILHRERTQFVGTIEMHEKFAFFVPDNYKNGTDIYIPKEKVKDCKNGDKVLARITAWPKSSESPFGEVIEILNSKNQNDNEAISILVNQGIDYKFPVDVIEQAEKVTMDLNPEEIKKRRDFREVTTFTIDPLDAKDFDDAISVKWLENGNTEVGVHIADVSHYVTEGSPMDVEALKRSNSVYLVDRVVPMLPEQLSNMACSLRPKEDKYSFSAVFEIDAKGKIVTEWFGKTIIHSDRRYTYEEAQQIIEGAEDPLKKEILFLDQLAKKYRKSRLKKGALSIDSEEIRFKLDQHGNPVEVVIKTSKDANKLVEEFMLLANKRVATFIGKVKKGKDPIPFIYRCHDKPDMEKVALFNTFIEKFGYELEDTHPDQVSTSINALLEDIRYKNEYSLIQSMAIRSMAKATYETTNIGHYGLHFEYYTHFTSPIRRYADLMVHRILFDELNGSGHKYGSKLSEIAKQISRNEKKAVEAERESTKFFQTLFMKDHINEEFEGTISGLADFGMFVRMNENQCEGMIPIIDIPGDAFYFDAEKFHIIGKRTKKTFNFGDKIKVKVTEVDTRKRQINLAYIKE